MEKALRNYLLDLNTKEKTKQRRAFYKGVMSFANSNIGRSQKIQSIKGRKLLIL
jgi:hypothetical protein